ncbi:unnamed protein product [Phytophthora lilii]|uniref:Unnamed protein product n=1 Tax=Phytophthora lilii TaxID=2077276 RepID=A0A9W6X9Y7_9STRA|nr:unnamed protein product [Phytophthora lilii]
MMEKVYERAGGRQKTQVRKVSLSDVGWGEAEVASLENCKQSLQKALQLAHPDPQKLLSVFTDASDEHWGAAITQIPRDQAARPLSKQEHQPLMRKSAWRQDGFAFFNDHRNLRFIFDPHSVSNSVPKYTADKLHRWSLLLMGYQYEIHDIAGDDNVRADLLSLWRSSFGTVCAIRQVPLPLSPQLEDNFVWPAMKAIFEVQNDATPPKDIKRSTKDLLLRYERGRIWIPDEAVDMQMRICVVGHFGIAGHCGMKVTLQQVKAKFVWTNMAKDVDSFVRRCLHCASTLGGPPQPRPLGEAMHAEKPNELIHCDFLFMGKSDTD